MSHIDFFSLNSACYAEEFGQLLTYAVRQEELAPFSVADEPGGR